MSILGATGKREDHTLGNIGYLVSFAEEYPDVEIEMLTDYGRFVALKGSRTFHSFPGQQVSVFSMDPECPIYSEGLRWPPGSSLVAGYLKRSPRLGVLTPQRGLACGISVARGEMIFRSARTQSATMSFKHPLEDVLAYVVAVVAAFPFYQFGVLETAQQGGG